MRVKVSCQSQVRSNISSNTKYEYFNDQNISTIVCFFFLYFHFLFYLVKDVKLHHNYPDGCLTLKSDNELFSEVIHDVGTKKLTLEMSSTPKILSQNRSLDGLWSPLEVNNMRSPFKVSYVLDMSANNVYLGCVRDKNHQTVYSPTKYCHADKGGYLKISDTGKLEIYNNEHKKLRMVTDFTGNQLSLDIDRGQKRFHF